MKLVKRMVTLLLVIIMLIPGDINKMTVLAENNEEKMYGPISKESDKLLDEDIPDVLIDSGELKKDIKDKYVKRLYEEEGNLNTLMFENDEGERTMYMFKKPVKYKDAEGNIVDKDVRFKVICADYHSGLSDKYICDNGNNDIKVYMPKNITNGIEVETDENSITMTPKGCDKDNQDVSVDEKKVVYEEAFGENTALQYTPLLDGVKEEIILEEYTGQTEFTFTIKLDGYKLVTLDDNSLYLENVDNGEIEGIIDSVYMVDATGKTNFNNYYTYKEVKEDEYEVTAHVNEEFLIDEATQYPVIIDPTLTIEKSKNSVGIYDATLNSTSTTEGASGSLYVGNRSDGENGISRVAMKFPGLNFTTSKVSVVLSASISIRDLMCESSVMGIECLAFVGISENWNESSASWNSLYMDKGPLTSSGRAVRMISYNLGLTQEEHHRYEFDITQIVKNWRSGVSGMSHNRGILFKSTNESVLRYKTFGSYNRASYNPVFKMEYVPYSGGYTYDKFENIIQRYAIPGTSITGYLPNCIGLIFLSAKKIDFSELGINTDADKMNVVKVAEKICEYVRKNRVTFSHIIDAKYIKCGLDSSDAYDLGENEYLVAIRVGVGKEKQLDLHGIVQMNNGQWIDKHGIEQNINRLGYVNPDEDLSCWITDEYKDNDSSNDRLGYRYYSHTAYIVVTTIPPK